MIEQHVLAWLPGLRIRRDPARGELPRRHRGPEHRLARLRQPREPEVERRRPVVRRVHHHPPEPASLCLLGAEQLVDVRLVALLVVEEEPPHLAIHLLHLLDGERHVAEIPEHELELRPPEPEIGPVVVDRVPPPEGVREAHRPGGLRYAVHGHRLLLLRLPGLDQPIADREQPIPDGPLRRDHPPERRRLSDGHVVLGLVARLGGAAGRQPLGLRGRPERARRHRHRRVRRREREPVREHGHVAPGAGEEEVEGVVAGHGGGDRSRSAAWTGRRRATPRRARGSRRCGRGRTSP
jgi:hypothetical protein